MRDVNAHLGDDAESYALGLLPLDDRASIEAHLSGCAACRQRVIAAEGVVWSLGTVDEPMVRSRQTPRVPWPALASAAAAALALVTAGETVTLVRQSQHIAATDSALSTIARSHFLHATLEPRASTVIAKVLYARDGSWIYCVVDGGGSYDVRLTSGGRQTIVGSTATRGSVADLYAGDLARPSSIELLRNGVVVARAALPYGS